MALKRTIKELANYFDQELHQILPLKVLANGSLIYKNHFVKKLHNNNWGVFNVLSNDLKEQYHLKSCAVMAAKAFNNKNYNRCNELKLLDNNYWSNYNNSLLYKNILPSVSDEKYQIILTKLEESIYQVDTSKNKIYKMFKHTFI